MKRPRRRTWLIALLYFKKVFLSEDNTHSKSIKPVVIPAQLLGAVHGDVGVAQHRLAVAAVGGEERDADARADREVAPVDAERRVQRAQDLVGHHLAVGV